VLSEKPLARTGEEAARMVQAAETSDRVLQVAFNYRRRGDVQLLRRIIDEGTLGRIYHARAWWLRRRGIPSLGSWFTSKEQAGGGPLIDLGVHLLDLVLHLTDQPPVLTVSGVTHAELGPRGRGGSASGKSGSGDAPYEVEDLASVFLRLVAASRSTSRRRGRSTAATATTSG
jgi:predicted dehydrogenase